MEEKQKSVWEGKKEQLNYKMELIKHHKELKEEYNMTDKQIVEIFPDMKDLIKGIRNKGSQIGNVTSSSDCGDSSD